LASSSSPYRPPIAESTTEQRPTIWPDASLIGVALIWGINIPIMKNGLDQVDSFVFNAVRLVVSASVLLSLAIWERKRGVLVKSGVSRTQIVVYAMIVSGLYQLLFLLGIARTTSGNVALIIATVPMWTALLAGVFLNERLAKIAWVGLFTALAGTVIVSLQKGDVGVADEHLIGNLCILGAALMWSIGTVYSRPMLKFISPMQLSGFAATMALPLHLLFAAGRYQESFPGLQNVNIWMIILYSGVLSTGLALPMWSYGVRHAGAAHAAIIQNAVPVIAMAAAWLTRGESASNAQLFGGVLIIGGLVIMRIGRNNEARAARVALAAAGQAELGRESK